MKGATQLFMAADDPSDLFPHLEQLKEEISRLTQEQENALRMAVYVGMTESEAADYDRRHSDIKALIQQLRTLIERPRPQA